MEGGVEEAVDVELRDEGARHRAGAAAVDRLGVDDAIAGLACDLAGDVRPLAGLPEGDGELVGANAEALLDEVAGAKELVGDLVARDLGEVRVGHRVTADGR